jgi:hypothetical protein
MTIQLIPVEQIKKPDFKLTPENTIGVMGHLTCMTDPDTTVVLHLISTLTAAEFISAVSVSIIKAESIGETEWLYNLYNLMEVRGVTFADLGMQMPDLLRDLLIELGEIKEDIKDDDKF